MPWEIIAGLATGAVSFFMKSQANALAGMKDLAELQIKREMTADQLANSAAKRSNPTARKVLAYMIIGTLVCGAFIYAIFALWMPNAVVSYVTEGNQKELLWGLFKWGGKPVVTVVKGFFYGPWSGYVISIVTGFFFGTGAAKGRS